MEPAVVAWSRSLAAAVADAAGDRLVGAYLHGSAALGGFVPGRSDVDLLFVAATPLTGSEREAVADAVAALSGCPGSGVECSVLTTAQAADPVRGAFELHVCTGPGAKVVDGRGHQGDDDLVLHALAVRAAGIALKGPPATTVFGEPPREVVLERLAAELRWSLDHASGAYAVLNACRALLWAEEGRVASKVEGGEWALRRLPSSAHVIERALASQRTGGGGPPGVDICAFVRAVMEQIEGVRA
jgi:streptomycin 3"-adenylyltransferase